MAKRKKNELKGEKVELKNKKIETQQDSGVGVDINEDSGLADNPLMQSPVIERDYASGENFDIRGDIIDSVEEPDTKKPIVDFTDGGADSDEEEDFGLDSSDYQNDDEEEDFGLDSDEEEPSVSGNNRTYEDNQEKFYDNFDELDSKTQKALTGNLADTVVDAYKMVIDLSKTFFAKSREKYQMKAIQGKFDMRVLDYKVDVGGGNFVKYGDFVEGYNDILNQTMTLEPEKEKEMRVLMKRIAVKHGMGLSDEARLGILVGTDVATKMGILISQNRMMNNVENYVTTMFKRQSVMGSGIQGGEMQQKPKQQKTNSTEKSNESGSNVNGTQVNIGGAEMEIKEKGE